MRHRAREVHAQPSRVLAWPSSVVRRGDRVSSLVPVSWGWAVGHHAAVGVVRIAVVQRAGRLPPAPAVVLVPWCSAAWLGGTGCAVLRVTTTAGVRLGGAGGVWFGLRGEQRRDVSLARCAGREPRKETELTSS